MLLLHILFEKGTHQPIGGGGGEAASTASVLNPRLISSDLYVYVDNGGRSHSYKVTPLRN
jgi:hypothetical protein